MTDHEESPQQATASCEDPALTTQLRMSERPSAWSGPTFVYRPKGLPVLFLGGWRARAVAWDHGASLLAAGVKAAGLPSDWVYESLQEADLEGAVALQETADCGFLEFITPPQDSGESVDPLWRLAADLLGLSDPAPLKSLPGIGSTSGTSNRPLTEDCSQSLGDGVTVTDLRFTAMPNSRGDRNRRLQYATRNVRLLRSDEAVVAVWSSPEESDSWSPQVLTWPHHAMPGLSRATLRCLAQAGLTTREAIEAYLIACLEHEAYFLRAWRSELDHWESWIFTAMAEGSEVLRDLRLGPDVRGRAGALSAYLNSTQVDLRTFERRLAVEPLLGDVSGHPEIRRHLESSEALLAENQVHRRDAQTLLASLAAGEQLQAARDQAEATARQAQATARLESTVLWLGALLLLPGLVVGVYGANLQELDPSVEGSLPMLTLWTLLACSIFALMVGLLVPPGGRSRGFLLALGAAAVLTSVVSATVAGTLLAGLLAGAVLATWAAVLLALFAKMGKPQIIGGVQQND